MTGIGDGTLRQRNHGDGNFGRGGGDRGGGCYGHVILMGNPWATWEVIQEVLCIHIPTIEMSTIKVAVVVANNGNQLTNCVTHLRTHHKRRNK